MVTVCDWCGEDVKSKSTTSNPLGDVEVIYECEECGCKFKEVFVYGDTIIMKMGKGEKYA